MDSVTLFASRRQGAHCAWHSVPCKLRWALRLLNALNSEDRGLKVRFSLAMIAFGRESAQMSQILSSRGKNASSNPCPHYLVRLATSRDGQNRQSPIASVQQTQSTLASHSAVPCGTNTTPTNANRAIRIAAQRTQGLRGPNSVFLRGRYDRQRTLVIRIAAITLASDSAITIARFRPAKLVNGRQTPCSVQTKSKPPFL